MLRAERFIAVMSLIAAAGCGGQSPATKPDPTAAVGAPASDAASSDRRYLLERVDDVAVVQLYAERFRALPLKEKALTWHLYQAALAGRDIFYDQRHAHNLEMRDVLEAIIVAGMAPPGPAVAGIDPMTFAEIQRYTKLFWINT